jgi:hypothetical protein
VDASETVDFIALNGTMTSSTQPPTTSTTSRVTSSTPAQKRRSPRPAKPSSGTTSAGSGNGGGSSRAQHGGNNRLSRIDRLITRVDPLATVSQKMDEVWNVVVGTKSTVDNLVPKSQQLLDKTQRQERAISIIHSDLTNMADQVSLQHSVDIHNKNTCI